MLCAVVAFSSGCIGTIGREDFNEIIAQRGGGFTSDLLLDAVGAVSDELGVVDFDLRSMTVVPLNETIVLEVRDPAVPQNLDRYVIRQGSIDAVEPIRLSAADDLEAQTFPVSRLALDRVEPMVDTALAAFERDGGYVSSMIVTRGADAQVFFQLVLESPRASGSALFTAGGELIEVTQA